MVILTTLFHLSEFPKQVKIHYFKLYKIPQYLGFITHLDYNWITFNPYQIGPFWEPQCCSAFWTMW